MSKAVESRTEIYDGYDQTIIFETPKRTWKGYIWDSLDKSPVERKFVFKLDVGLMIIASLGYFSKYLDQANISNAYVSGMKEDLDMLANQLNYAQTLWTVGYILGEVPSNILITKIRPSIWLPSIQLLWTVLTFCSSRVSNVRQLYALRFLVGLTEAGYYPGIIYLLSSWYRKDELAKRASIFNAVGGVATMFSGYLMDAVIGLDGRNGFKGWQWLFIMDGVISLPISLAGFFLFPDFPHSSRAFYLNQRDREIAVRRVELENRAPNKPLTIARFFKIFKTWHIYVLPLVFFCAGAAGAAAQPLFALYLKSTGTYTVRQINLYPTASSGVQVFCTIAYAYISDSVLKGRRWPIIVFAALVNIILFGSLAVWNIPEGWRWACYILLLQGVTVSPLSLVWGNEILTDDNEKRAVITASMNSFSYVVNAWLPLIVWQTVDSPVYHKGFTTAACASGAGVLFTLLARYLAKSDERRAQNVGKDITPSSPDLSESGPEKTV